MNFISQSSPDTTKEIQKLEEELGMPPSHLVVIAFRVFNSRDQIQERQKQCDMRHAALPLQPALSRDEPRPKTSTGKN